MGLRTVVTGGAGFIGRWVVAELLAAGHRVRVLDNLSSGAVENLQEFAGHGGFEGLVEGDVRDQAAVERLFSQPVDLCIHLAASINVQDSIERPRDTFENDVAGTFNLLESARSQFVQRNGSSRAPGSGHRPTVARGGAPKVVMVSTCLVYETAAGADGMDERHAVRALSPYAASKLAAEHLTLSYHAAYGMPTVVVRPFNTYGPYQKASLEGGVLAIFLQRCRQGQPLLVKGTGEQTRDFIYVSDCARFILAAGLNDAANGRIVNGGSGREIAIKDLARLIAGDRVAVQHVPHDHPQAEILRMRSNNRLARTLLGWEPRVSLEQGITMLQQWIPAVGGALVDAHGRA